MAKIVPALLAALVLTACKDTPPSDEGQPPSCTECSIKFDLVTTVGSPDDPSAIASNGRTTQGPDGFYVTPTIVPGVINHYGSDGKYMGALGRVGSGPGEYRGPLLMTVDRDTLHIFDLQNARWTAVNDKGETVRTTRLGGYLGFSMTHLRGGELAFYLSPQSGNDSTIPLHIVSPDGTIKSFGPAAPGGAVENNYIAAALNGGIWLLDAFNYRISEWSAGGKLERTFDLQRPWFVTELPTLNGSVQESVRRRGSNAISIHEGADGLWVALNIVNEKWQPPANIPLNANGFPESSVYEGKYRTVIEVLDPATGNLIARGKAPDALHFMNDSLAYAFHADDDGEVTHRIYRYSLRR